MSAQTTVQSLNFTAVPEIGLGALLCKRFQSCQAEKRPESEAHTACRNALYVKPQKASFLYNSFYTVQGNTFFF